MASKKKGTIMVATPLKLEAKEIAKLLSEGVIGEQFIQIWKLQDEKHPNFASKIISLFVEDSEKLVNELGKSIDQESVNYKEVEAQLIKMKNYNAWIGAKGIEKVCNIFRKCCEEKNTQECLRWMQHLRHEFSVVRNSLKLYVG